MKRSTIRGSVILPPGKVPNRHVLYRKYAGEARAEAERFALDHDMILADDPPTFVGTEPLAADPDRTIVVFELVALTPEADR